MTQVQGRTAFITGAGNGIGLGIARAFAYEGVKLALVDIDERALETARAQLSYFTAVETAVLDVRDRDRFERVADGMERALGPVSILVNNAGVAGGAPAAAMTYDLWDWGLATNLGGVINGVQTFLPRMVAHGDGGHIVNTASASGLAICGSTTLYHTAKFAVVGLSESLHQELAGTGIEVSVLCPGPVATDIVARTQALQPASAPLTAQQRQAAETRVATMRAKLQQGVSPDAVGELVVDGVLHNRFYVHTDRFAAVFIEDRAKALLAAMPAG